jgi:hypothetical protein
MKNTTRMGLLALACALAAPLALARPQETKEAAAPAASTQTDEQVIAAQLPSYPLGTCVVSEEEMGGEHGEIVDFVLRPEEGEPRLFRLCCKGCKKMLAKDPEAAIAALDARIVAEQAPLYALETCAVSGEPLGSMGEPVDMVVGTRLVRLCCKGCKKGVAKDPAKAVAKADEAAMKQQAASYPLETCVVSGEPLGDMGEPVEFMYGYRLVKLCCKGCKKGFEKNPSELVAKLDTARASK